MSTNRSSNLTLTQSRHYSSHAVNKKGLFIFRCALCGQQWLSPRTCCRRTCAPARQRLGSLADSLEKADPIDFSIVTCLNGSTTSSSVRQAVKVWLKRLVGERFEFIYVVHSTSAGVLEFITDLAHTCTLRLLRLTARASLGRLYNLGAQAARGRRLLLNEPGIPLLPPGTLQAFAVALVDARVGLVGLSRGQDTASDSSPSSCDPRYRFSVTPMLGPVVGLRPEVFWELGGIDEQFKSYTVAMKDLQYRLISSNYRLAQVPLTHRSAWSVSASARVSQTQLRADRKRFTLKYRRQLKTLEHPEQLFTNHSYPKLSVAIATRNYGRWLPRCLNSILRSADASKATLQIVVTDDCSTDNTALILERYRKRYPRVFNVIRPRTSGGVPLAKNLAIHRSIGSYVALHDADDEFYPAKVARCLTTLGDNPEADFLTHDYKFIDSATGQSFVPGDDWFGNWRPPGVWVFRAGRVNLNEQMVCGYEELEWAMRFWNTLRRIHVTGPLTIVHGQYVSDRWKVDREIAGVQSMKRWRMDAKSKRGSMVFACSGCGNQYLNQIGCCDALTIEVPLVCYMAVASAPSHLPVRFSLVVFTRDDLAATRRCVTAAQKDPETKQAELIFVHCHPRRDFLDYLRELSRETKVKAVFSPREDTFVYSHDANRAARCADGSLLAFMDVYAVVRGPTVFSAMRQALSNEKVGFAGLVQRKGVPKLPRTKISNGHTQNSAIPLSRSCYGLRQELFWELGGMDEAFEGDGIETLDLQYRAVKRHYGLEQVDVQVTFNKINKMSTASKHDHAHFARKHGLRGLQRSTQFKALTHHRKPEISIALATRNEERFLPRWLDRILRSTKTARIAIQVVIVNDCSTDDTRLILEEYRQHFFENLTLLHNERVLGPARARNLALSRCAGAYVALARAEDQFRWDELSNCLRLLRESGADLMFHSIARDANQPQAISRVGRRIPDYGAWIFRNGVVRFNEQMITVRGEREWFERQASLLQTIHTPVRLIQRQKQLRGERGIA